MSYFTTFSGDEENLSEKYSYESINTCSPRIPSSYLPVGRCTEPRLIFSGVKYWQEQDVPSTLFSIITSSFWSTLEFIPPSNNTAKTHCRAGNWATVQQPCRCTSPLTNVWKFVNSLRNFTLLQEREEDFEWGKTESYKSGGRSSHGKCSSLLPCPLQAVRDDRARLLHAGRDREMLQHPGHVLLVTKFCPHMGKRTLPWGTIQIFAIICPLTLLNSKNKRAQTAEILLVLTLLGFWLIG